MFPHGCRELRNAGCARLGFVVPVGGEACTRTTCLVREDRAKVIPGRRERQVEAHDEHIWPGLVPIKVSRERVNSVVLKRSRQET